MTHNVLYPFFFFFNVQSGVLVGCGYCSYNQEITASASTVHGVTIGRKLRVGVGLSFDAYQNLQARPVFGSVSWDLIGSKNRNALFLQVNYGWARAKQNKYNDSYPEIKGGAMLNTQVGFRIKYHDLKISIGVGHKSQKFTAFNSYPSYYYDYLNRISVQGDQLNTTTFRQTMNRLSLMMAIGWK